MVSSGMPRNWTEIFEKILTASDAPRREAEKAFEQGNFSKAAFHYEQAAEKEVTLGKNAELYALSGYCHLKAGDINEAESRLRRAQKMLEDYSAKIAILPESHRDPAHEAWLPSGLVMHHIEETPAEDTTSIEVAYKLVIRLGHPEFSAKAALNLGTLYYNNLGKPADARKFWETALTKGEHAKTKGEHAKTEIFAAYNLGWFWENEGDYEKARNYYRLTTSKGKDEVGDDRVPVDRAIQGLRRLKRRR